jgi:poly-beta-1,6-N-acetyl-D-glucosamine synthase
LNSFFSISAIVYSIFGLIIYRGLKIQFKKEKSSKQSIGSKISLKDVTVIIPFRNELKNLPKLIESIENQKQLPAHFIFVNDHSDDTSEQLLTKLNPIINYRILNLPADQIGKKRAIRHGIENAKTDLILTMDADLTFNSTYFSSLENIRIKDMLILPVIMKGEKGLQKFYEFDYAVANAINSSIAGLKRPFIASGANLLFKKNCFLKYDSFDDHKSYSSGDDVFLLRDFQKNNCSVELITDLSSAVYTATPEALKTFFKQRIRWIGKGRQVNDNLSNTLAFFALFFHTSFIIAVVYLLANDSILYAFLTVGFKTGIDMYTYLPYFQRIQRIKTWLLIPISNFIYPFYILALIVMATFTSPHWKGRNIYK